MAVCANRPETPGFFTACVAATPDHKCLCAEQVKDEISTQRVREAAIRALREGMPA